MGRVVSSEIKYEGTRKTESRVRTTQCTLTPWQCKNTLTWAESFPLRMETGVTCQGRERVAHLKPFGYLVSETSWRPPCRLLNLLFEDEDALPLLRGQHSYLFWGELQDLHDQGGLQEKNCVYQVKKSCKVCLPSVARLKCIGFFKSFCSVWQVWFEPNNGCWGDQSFPKAYAEWHAKAK